MNPLEMNSKQIGGFQLRIVERTPNKRLSSLGLGFNNFYYTKTRMIYESQIKILCANK